MAAMDRSGERDDAAVLHSVGVQGLVHQAGLADPGLTEHLQQMRSGADRALEEVGERGGLGLAVDEGSQAAFETGAPAAGGAQPKQSEAGERQADAFRLHRRQRFGVDEIAHEVVGLGAEIGAAGFGGLLQPGGDMDRGTEEVLARQAPGDA